MKLRLILFPLFTLLAMQLFSCTHERQVKDEHRKYRVIKEDSIQKIRMEDHMRDNMPH